MWVVAGEAILLCLALCVGLVALKAFWNEAMFWVAARAGYLGVEALIGLELFAFILVTCHTGVCDLFGKGDV